MIPELRTLLDMLTYCRPMGSLTESAFIDRWIRPLGAIQDLSRNWHMTVPRADGSPSRVLWSCHTDTVARQDGRQTVHYEHATGMVGLSRRSRAAFRNCLGADDTAGVWLCVQMIQANVPGHYVFHYGEERGGIGSSALAYGEPHRLDGLDCAIALDRRGTDDVITHQYGMRCASDAFADSLALEIFRASDERLIYGPAHGIYTDTAEYVSLVRECTNLSVGYQDEHTADETLDVDHAIRLLNALRLFDETALVIEKDVEPVWDNWNSYSEPSIEWTTIRKDGTTIFLPRDVDASPNVDDDGFVLNDDDDDDDDETLAVDCYLDRVHRDVQRALLRHDCPRCGRDTFVGFDHRCNFEPLRFSRMVD